MPWWKQLFFGWGFGRGLVQATYKFFFNSCKRFFMGTPISKWLTHSLRCRPYAKFVQARNHIGAITAHKNDRKALFTVNTENRCNRYHLPMGSCTYQMNKNLSSSGTNLSRVNRSGCLWSDVKLRSWMVTITVDLSVILRRLGWAFEIRATLHCCNTNNYKFTTIFHPKLSTLRTSWP